MSLERVHDWPERLDRMISSARAVPFEWGRFDCALHVANCIREITVSRVDVAASYRGKYSDEAGAAQIYGTSFEQFIASMATQLALPEVPVRFAHRGDVVFLDNRTPQGAVGVVSCDPRFVACASTTGVVFVPLARWRRAWRIGA